MVEMARLNIINLNSNLTSTHSHGKPSVSPSIQNYKNGGNNLNILKRCAEELYIEIYIDIYRERESRERDIYRERERREGRERERESAL